MLNEAISVVTLLTKLRVVVSAPSALLCCRVRPRAAAPAAKLGIRGTGDAALAEAPSSSTPHNAGAAAVSSILSIVSHCILTRTLITVQIQNNHQGHYK